MAKTEPINDETAQIGHHIRELRKRQNLTLKMLGEQVGLSDSYLSQIENGYVDLNITNLKAISEALGVPLITFFVNGTPPGVSVVRQANRRWYEHQGGQVADAPLLKTPGNLEIFTVRLLPGSSPTPTNNHPGEEITYVVKGSVRLVLNQQQFYDLNEGDIIYYMSDIPHHWQNLGNEAVEILVVNTPATY
ncbi:MAG: helix-turn-helix domain-containing protein [Anaerolineae bacterium]